ncbi:MAG: (2Fe-2S)-binding protein, partial [Gammaproteobacteria bacterium]|nr:(2Fe-2S)-binding protein [Gammaproteobacteria bacterium]
MNTVRLSKFQRGASFEIEVDGKLVAAYAGETIASVLLAAGVRAFHQSSPGQAP